MGKEFFFDIVIIGGGVVGSALARELSRYNVKVALLEKEIELAFGVSKSNSGIIHPGTQNPADSLKGRLCVLGNKLVKDISKELGVDYKEVGELIVIFDENQIGELIKIKNEAEKLGVPNLKIVDSKWLKKEEPNLSKNVIAALYAPTAGIISPYRWTYDLAENAIANGVEIYTNNEVVEIKYENNDLALADKRRFAVKTRQGNIFYSNYCINCAGLYADKVSAFVGLDYFKITPRKGEEYLLDKKLQNITKHLIFPLPTNNSKGILVIKTSDGNPMVGPTAQDVVNKEDLTTTDEGFKKVFSQVKKMVPIISENSVIAYFAGLRPVAGKDFIIKHENKVPGFVNVAGIQSPGLTASYSIALFVVDILKLNGCDLSKKKNFKKHRKKTIHLFSIPLSETKKLVKSDESYGDIVCRCEMVSAKEIRDAVKRGAKTIDGIKFRTRATAGRCHGGFCTIRVAKILSEELNLPITEITKRGNNSKIVFGEKK